MQIDPKKLKRQNQVINKWLKNKACGTLQATTGFGKTYVALMTIQRMNERNAERTTLVVVPTQYLKSQWEEQVENLGLLHVTVLVINTAIKVNREFDLLVLDEIHNYASNEFIKIFETTKYKFILGLTATIDRKDNRDALIRTYCPVIDTVDIVEALENGYVSNFKVFNLGIEMNEEDAAAYQKMNKDFHFNFAQFNHDFNTAMSCLSNKSYRESYARTVGRDPSELAMYAINFSRNMQKRKNFLYFASSKKKAVLELLKEFSDKKAITFSEGVDFAKDLHKEMPQFSVDYHSKMPKGIKSRNLNLFNDEKSDVHVIHTAKALDEGFDVKGIDLAIISSGTSSTRQDLQRTGRAIRYQEGKTAVIINIYIKDTQDERWLRARQKKSTNIIHVNSIQEIKTHLSQREIPTDGTSDPASTGRYNLFGHK